MGKKRSNLKVITDSKSTAKGILVNSRSRTALQQSAAQDSGRSPISEGFAKQVFSSEEQALELLVSQVVSRYEDDPQEQAEMRKFLQSVLETDPVLRSEILSGATIRR